MIIPILKLQFIVKSIHAGPGEVLLWFLKYEYFVLWFYRVKPPFIEDDEVNLHQPPVSIQVASPEDEDDLEDANTLGHR